jgi:hypothetical protein
MSFLINKSFVNSSIYTLIYSITNFGSMHKEHYLGKFENRARPSFVTRFYLFYIQGVDYNESVISMIYHIIGI